MNQNTITLFERLIENIKTRRGLYVFDPSYSSLVAFICGYILGVRDAQGFDYSEEFHKWLEKKEGKEEKDAKEEAKKPKNVTLKEPLTSGVEIVDKKDPSAESIAA
ncbi:MAG: hypothetical protein AAFX87_26500, partial [Bacteroidota bacterium]